MKDGAEERNLESSKGLRAWGDGRHRMRHECMRQTTSQLQGTRNFGRTSETGPAPGSCATPSSEHGTRSPQSTSTAPNWEVLIQLEYGHLVQAAKKRINLDFCRREPQAENSTTSALGADCAHESGDKEGAGAVHLDFLSTDSSPVISQAAEGLVSH